MFGDADKSVAMNAALVLESVLFIDFHLRCEAMKRRVDRCTNDGGIARVDDWLPTDDYEYTV